MKFAYKIVGMYLLIVTVTIAVFGCSRQSARRATVYGNVSLNGKPISEGKIIFLPVNGAIWSALIKDGKYSTEGTKGVATGEVRVEIHAYRKVAKTETNPEGIEITSVEQYLPTKFNERSSLKVTIEPSATPLEKNFHLME